MTRAERKVVRAADALVNRQGWAYFGLCDGRPVSIKGVICFVRLEEAIANYRAALTRARRKP